jgi:hypothetical protein
MSATFAQVFYKIDTNGATECQEPVAEALGCGLLAFRVRWFDLGDVWSYQYTRSQVSSTTLAFFLPVSQQLAGGTTYTSIVAIYFVSRIKSQK